MIYPLQLNLIM